MSLYIKSTIDFLILNYNYINSFIDGQQFISEGIMEGEQNGVNMDYIKNIQSNVTERFQNNKDFKESWSEFSNEYFSLEALYEYLLNEIRK